MRVLIIGDSHTGALKRGLALGPWPEGIAIEVAPLGLGAQMNQPFWEDRGDHAVLLDPQYAALVPRLPPVDPRPDAIGLSLPLWSGRLIRVLVESWLVPYGAEGPGRRLSGALLRRLVQQDMAQIMALTRFLQGQGLPLFVIEAPRAFRVHRSVVLRGADFVLTMQRQIRAIQAAEIAALGLPIVYLPDSALDPDGFMSDRYAHEDPADTHHANAAFGALMIERSLPVMRQILQPA